MDFPIDTALTLIYVIYKSVDSFINNGNQLLLLVDKIRQFEVPLMKLKSSIVLDDSMECHIEKLNDLLLEVRNYIDDFQSKGKIRRLIGALFTDESIKEFHQRLDEIKRDMNFEFDLNNHLIFHSFNVLGSQISRNFETTLSELKSLKLEDSVVYLHNFLQGQLTTLRFDLEMTIERKVRDMLHAQNIDGARPAETPAETVELSNEKRPTSRGAVLKQRDIINMCKNLYLQHSIRCAENIPLKRHVDLVLLILILDTFKGHYFFDGNSISKCISYSPPHDKDRDQICSVPVHIPMIRKAFHVHMHVCNLPEFLYTCGFRYFATWTKEPSVGVVPYEISCFYNREHRTRFGFSDEN